MITRQLREHINAYLFLSPALIIIAIFSFIPIVSSFALSFCKWRILGKPEFCGIKNYISVFTDPVFWIALKNTLYYSFVTVPAGLVLALASAVLLNQKLKGRVFFRGVIFFPVTISMVVIALIWGWMFSEHYGIVNTVLEEIGILPRNWMANPKTSFPIIMILSIWKGFGYGMVIYLAALQSIPKQYYEAAAIDGANPIQKFLHITLPLLNPTTLFVLVIAFIGSFQVFDQVYIMTGGGPGYSTTVLVSYIYDEAYGGRFRMGRASSIAYILFCLLLLFTLLQLKVFKEKGFER
ncbi:sugar ABC transporter permease [Candidatus Sumerlaeota bacterium]|nr:sugar ABC transporter permease [Candidatus Sumerlaeota bacterium]